MSGLNNNRRILIHIDKMRRFIERNFRRRNVRRRYFPRRSFDDKISVEKISHGEVSDDEIFGNLDLHGKNVKKKAFLPKKLNGDSVINSGLFSRNKTHIPDFFVVEPQIE